jgi:hypothetical protein
MIATLLLLLACGTKTTAECSENTPCSFGSVCVSGKCQEQLCATSDQCDIEQYCTEKHVCTSGCQADSDCKFGDVCDTDTNTCTPKKCGSGRVDCSFGQFCNISGECYDAGGYYCRSCNDDYECGGNGNLCIGGYCGVACEHDSDCPNGYNCLAFTDLNGNVVAQQCYTACSLYAE